MVPGVVLLTAALAACGGSSKSATSKTTPANGPTTTVHVAHPASDVPSESAKQICSEAVKDIQTVLGVPAKVSTPTWVDHVYACNYQYPNGVMRMSVKELSNADETTAYYNSLATKLGKTQDLESLGQGAFSTKNGSVVVRKDYKVLLVDTSGLPVQFGVPPDTRNNNAINVAYTIMGCWTGA